MALKTVGLDQLRKSGLAVVPEMWDAEMKRVIQDLIERPGEDSARVVTLEMKVKPVCNQQGVADGATATFTCKAKFPIQQTREYSMGLHPSGQLLFNDVSPDNAQQRTLDEKD